MDPTLAWILVFGFLMSAIALLGGVLVLLPEAALRRLVLPLVALAAGSLIGGALFHMLPHALSDADPSAMLAWLAVGFALFFALDQVLAWHHCHRLPSEHVRPLGPLLLIADGAHNLLGGLAIGSVFVVDVGAGIAAWTAAALHEVPQEMGDFGALIHAGYTKRRALLYNFASALTFPLGACLAWVLGGAVEVHGLIALGAGSFIYIAAADLLPELKGARRLGTALARFTCFAGGLAFLYVLSVVR